MGTQGDASRATELHKQFIHFCENTTIRGIPRIVKTDNRRIRLLWSFFVIVLFVSCVLCLTFLIGQFLEYDVMHPPRVLKDTNSPFPSITICNMRPLSSRGKRRLRQLEWKVPREFSYAVERYTRHLYYHNESTRHVYYNLSGSFGFAAFLESLPHSDAVQLGHDLTDFIVDCKVVVRNGSARNQLYCSEHFARPEVVAGTFNVFLHASFMNCFTLDLKESLRDSATLVELAVYLDNDWNMENLQCVDCYQMDITTQLSGAILTIHAGDTYPDVSHAAVHLKSGSLTEVKLKHVLNVQKEAPYGRCSPQTPDHLSLYGRQYRYSEDACRQATIQQDIVATCGCQAIEYPRLHDNVTYCTGLHEFLPSNSCRLRSDEEARLIPDEDRRSCRLALEKVYKYVVCKRRVISKYAKDVVPSCTLPCSFFGYETERSTSDWPTRSWQLGLLTSRTYNRLLKRRELQPYSEAMKLQKQGRPDAAFQLLQNVTVLERNLLSIQLIRPNFDLHKVEEKEVLSLTSFLSQVGGLFSIFIGLTMISIVELIDFCINCYDVCHSRQRRSEVVENRTLLEEIGKGGAVNETESANA